MENGKEGRFQICILASISVDASCLQICLLMYISCGQEFHINCCTPALFTIPKGSFYCFDCSEKGSTKQLEEYFSQHEQRKEEHERLLLRNSKKNKGVPSIFADALLEEDILKESKEKNLSEGNDLIKQKNKNRTSASRARDEEQKVGLLVPCSELEVFYGRREDLVGKPVRMYCPLGNSYHNGRILDTRTNKISKGTICLVRFPAGKDHRKTNLTVWIDLEEHSLAVATDIVWACFGTKENESRYEKKKPSSGSTKKGKLWPQWTQAKLWRRNARELVPVLDSLIEDQDQIRFRKINATTENPTRDADKVATMSSTKGSVRWGLCESFGPPGFYQLLNLELATKSDNPSCSTAHTPASMNSASKAEQAKIPILKGLVEVELQEQERVRKWHTLPLNNYMHKHTLKSQDEMALGPLAFETPMAKEFLRTTLLVDHGLDRSLILGLVTQNLNPNPNLPLAKDKSIDMVCAIVESLPATLQSIAVKDTHRKQWAQ